MQKRFGQWTTSTTWIAGAAIAISPTVACVPAAYAQVTAAPDGTGTRVFRNGDLFNIRGGTQAGANLFHNFESLNIESNQTVNFLPDSNVLNIVGQVSGPDPSYIEGQLQVQTGSEANLYLINPQGVLFGPDAQLSLSGSFTVATADQVEFGDAWLDVLQAGSDYTNLTAPPSAFRFTAATASAVINQGDLSVQAGESLTLIGGNVVSEGRLEAPGGEIGLVAVGGESTVRFGVPGSLLSLEIAEKDFGTDIGSSFSPTDLPALLTGESGAGTDAVSTNLVVTSDNRVVLSGTGVESKEVVVAGSISTSSRSANGGVISLAGHSVDVLSATVEASGNSGGTIRIGSDSASGNLPASRLLLLRDNPIIKAQGLQGAGGNIIISATNTSIEEGTISAQGATQGGLIETSATQGFKVLDGVIDASGQADGGRWLLNSSGVSITDDVSNPKRIHSAAIERALDAGTNVEIDAADQDISLLRSINQTGGSQADLTLRARRFIANGPTINLASTGQLSFDIKPHNQLGGSSVQSAIASIGSMNSRPLLNLGAGTYDFSNTVVIDNDIDIAGATTGKTIFSASGNGRIFDVASGTTATLKDLTVTTSDSFAASDTGGGIVNAGTLSTNNVLFEDNRGLFGGAIHNKPGGVLTVANSSFINNRATEAGGAISADNSAVSIFNSAFNGNSAKSGGAIKLVSAASPVRITGSTFTGNTATDDGGAIHIQDTDATISNTTFTSNNSTDDGAAAAIRSSGQTTFNQVTFKSNSANDGGAVAGWDGATIVFNEATFDGNRATGSGGALVFSDGTYQINSSTLKNNTANASGGGILSYRSALEINDSTLRSNIANRSGGAVSIIGSDRTAASATSTQSNFTRSDFIGNEARDFDGGAIRVSDDAAVNISGGTFVKNSAGDRGGAIAHSSTDSLQVAGATFVGNEAVSDGGAVYNAGTLEAVNVTISGNQASDEGGGIKTAGVAANLTLSNATIVNNSAGRLGGGIHESEAQSTRLLNTIVAGNQSAIAADVSGRFTDEGSNLIGQSDGSTGFTRSFLVGAATNLLDPKLNPLADNGGLNQTHLPQADSPVINAGVSDLLLVTDQRGFDRVVGAAVDIGAVETAATEVPPELLEIVSPNLPNFVIAAVPIPALAALRPTALNAALPAISQLSTTSTDDAENKNRLLPTSAETQARADDVAIRKVESTFSQSYQDYWNMPIQDDLSFQQVQAVLRRAQDEYQVNSAVIYAAFTPAEAPIERREDILSPKAARSDSDLLQLLLVTPKGELVTHQLPVTRKEADRQVRLFRSNVADPEDVFGYRPLAQQFYQWLLAPLEEDLAAQGIQNLLYSLDEGLRTVPVAAMQDDDGYSLERYGISVIPTMGLMQTDFSARVRRSTVAMGVAEFDGQAPLPAVPIELDFVKNFVPAATTTLNEGTTLAALQAVQTLEQPGVLHLATHADFDARSPESSSIHLWNNPLSMAEFKALDWASADLEMLILSACVTALSSSNSELGFAGLAAASGVDATVGSLWQVSDTGTLALMSEFYIQLENTGLRFEALRKAQLSLLKGETRIQNGNLLTSQGEIDLPDDWNLPDRATLDHPFYWSAFTMVGNPW